MRERNDRPGATFIRIGGPKAHMTLGMHRPDSPAYNRTDVFIVDDCR